MIYVELENKNSSEMGNDIGAGSSVAVFFYSLVGIFGYAIFVGNQNLHYASCARLFYALATTHTETVKRVGVCDQRQSDPHQCACHCECKLCASAEAQRP